jgi:hypothetical protein
VGVALLALFGSHAIHSGSGCNLWDRASDPRAALAALAATPTASWRRCEAQLDLAKGAVAETASGDLPRESGIATFKSGSCLAGYLQMTQNSSDGCSFFASLTGCNRGSVVCGRFRRQTAVRMG